MSSTQAEPAGESAADDDIIVIDGPENDKTAETDSISRSATSLGPEKMFELMKQMKEVVRTNPSEAKSMLLQNPQLAYALLQIYKTKQDDELMKTWAQVVMRIVDPEVVMLMMRNEGESMNTGPPSSNPEAPMANTGAPVMNPVSSAPNTSFPPPSSNRFTVPPRNDSAGMSLVPNIHHPPPAHAFAQPMPAPTVPSARFSRAPPPVPQQRRQPFAPQPNMSAEEQANAQLLMQVMQLTDAEIRDLPPADREKIIELRNELGRR